ncbi:MAG TPA: class I SAM-dependent methyltransferase [Polyangiaceae bacterium]
MLAGLDMLSGNDEFRSDYNQTVARYYDGAYATLASLGPDVDFYAGLAVESGGPVLELGCGTGRVLLEVARRGVACTGLDSSEAMLNVLREKPGAEKLELHRTAMQNFDFGARRFALVFSAFRAFQHLYGVDEQLACLERVRRHLAPGGRFAFDVFCPRLDRTAREREPETEDLRFEDGADTIVRSVTVERDVAGQMMRLDMRFERHRNGNVVSGESERINLRWFYRYELEHLMFRAGFSRVEIHGDFDGSAVASNSPAYVVVAS